MLRFLTAGESHGPGLTAILEGLPAGLPLAPADVDAQLQRRQQGLGSGGRMRIEEDRVRLAGGVLQGRTTGAPIALLIDNRDWANWRDREIRPMTVPRPGHADLAGAVKYGYRDLRLALERASARETAARVAVGAVCRRLLAELGMTLGGVPADEKKRRALKLLEQVEQFGNMRPPALRAAWSEAHWSARRMSGVMGMVADRRSR